MKQAKLNRLTPNNSTICKVCGCRIKDKYEYCAKHYLESHKVVQPYLDQKPYFDRSKKERRKWWKSLTPEQQKAFVDKKVADKGQKRLQREITASPTLRKLSKYKGKNCRNCFHHKVKACDGLPDLTMVCKYHSNPKKIFESMRKEK